MSRSRYKIFENEYPYFLTCTIVNWLPLFGFERITKMVLDSLHFLQKEQRLKIYSYVIMENHLHLIASAEDLSKEMGDFKSYTVKIIIKLLEEEHSEFWLSQLRLHKAEHKRDSEYQFWQEGNHPQQIYCPEMMRQKIEYIHNNPVRRGYVDEQTDWRYSSARNNAGLPSLLDIEKEWC